MVSRPEHPLVLRMITRLNIGGPARQALTLTRQLRPTFRTMLVSGTPAPHEGEFSDPDVTVEHLPFTRSVAPPRDVVALWHATRLVRAQAPDIVHTHMAKAGAIGRTAAAIGRRRAKTVHTFHGHVLEGYFRPSVQRAFIASERLLAKQTDVLVAISPEIKDDLLALGIGRDEQYRVIPLGFDLAEHRQVSGPSGALRGRLGLLGDVPLVGVVGRLAPIKNHASLLRSMALLPDAHLAILGDGELRAALEAQVDEAGIGERVHFVGWWTDIPAAMADMDVVVLSSRNEGTPVSLIEAGACGRPVVSTDVGGVRSVVEDGVSGHLVPRDDEVAMAAAIEALLRDPERGRQMGASGRQRSERFALDRLVREVSALYEELLGP